MTNLLFDLNNIRMEISFKSYDELRSILSFYQDNDLYKINIPCKSSLKKEFLLNSIKISKEEFPRIDIVPHFSIMHEFRRNSLNTQNSFIEFLKVVKNFGCREVLLVSGSQKRVTLDSVSALNLVKGNSLFSNTEFSIGVAFNPYLPGLMFDEEIIRLEEKLNSGIVNSIWIQFGTDCRLFENRMRMIKDILLSTINGNSKISNINLYGSLLIPSKQFLSRFKYRPWKGVYCSRDFLDSVEFATKVISNLLECYEKYKICPIVESNISSQRELSILNSIL